MTTEDLAPDISRHIDLVRSKDDNAFCMISNRFHEGGHPLPICRVDGSGIGIECGCADMLIVRDGAVILRADVVKEGAPGNIMEVSEGCLFYECKDAHDLKERGPYEIAKGCVTLKISKPGYRIQ